MKKLNFTKMPIMDVEGNVNEMDLCKQIADTIYQISVDIQAAELAMRIYKEKELELTEEEVNIIKNHLEKGNVLAFVKMAFNRMVGD